MLRFRFRCLVLSMMLIITAVAVGACGIVFAADTIPAHTPLVTSPAPSALVGFLQDTVLPVVAAFVLSVFTLFMQRLGTTYKIQALTDQNSFVFKLAAQGVALAEEQAARLAGSVSALSGSDKLSIAVNHILAFFPKLTIDQAKDVVHSVLAQIPGAGATGEAVTLLPGDGGYSIPAPVEGPTGTETTVTTVVSPSSAAALASVPVDTPTAA
jgi:hypothetical protein